MRPTLMTSEAMKKMKVRQPGHNGAGEWIQVDFEGQATRMAAL